MTPSKLTMGFAAAALLLEPGGALAAHHRHATEAAVTGDDTPAASHIATVGGGTPSGLHDSELELVGGALAMLGGTALIGFGLLTRRR